MVLTLGNKIPYPPGPENEILNLLSQVCDSVAEPPDNTDEHRSYLQVLEWRIKKAIDHSHADQTTNSTPTPDAPTVARLFQLATLLYMSRMYPSDSENPTQLIDSAFTLLRQLETCQWPFPLLIFACETRGDAERKLILDLIARTEISARVRSFGSLKSMVRFVWTQDDLSEEVVGYADMMSTFMSISDSVPSFV